MQTVNSDIHGKLPPQAVEFEEAVLGAMMLETNRLTEVISILRSDAFYLERNKLIYLAILKLYDRNEAIDILTVTEELRRSGDLEKVGGAYQITILTNRIASTANIEYHSRIVLEKYIQREIICSSTEIISMAYDPTSDAIECMAALERSVQTVNNIIATGNSMKPIGHILTEVESEAKRRESLFRTGRCTGIPTGIATLDKRTSGWQKSDLIILAGRPSMGKTALMLHHALHSGVHVCLYSLEMSSVSLVNRMILSMSDLDSGRFRAGAFTPMEWEDFYKAKAELEKMPIYIDDNAVVSARYIKSHSKQMHDRGLCDMVMVDYLQLTDMRSETFRNREQDVSATTREMKIIAKTLDIPVVLLSQLNRSCEARADKKPQLSDLRESGAIEQDADIVIFAYRPEYYGLKDEFGNPIEKVGYEIIAKGRNIGTGEIPFKYNESMTKIYDYQPDEMF